MKPKLSVYITLPERFQSFLLPTVMFITTWCWAAIWWGDVFWTAQERSFFACEPELMQGIWSRPFGSLWLIGRALLSLCAWPWLGGFLLAFILTCTGWCLAYIMRLAPLWAWTAYIPSVAWIIGLTYFGYDTYYKSEPGRIFGIPALALIVVVIQAIFLRSFRKHRHQGDRQVAITVLLIPVFVFVTMLWERFYRPWVRPTCKMERQYAQEDWSGIRKTAIDNATISCRPMAAYYAIALVRQDAIMKHLFDIRFEYDDIYMHDRAGGHINSTPYYIMECDMHAGLLQFAYHKAMEDLTLDGPTVHNLKILAQVAAMRHEHKVCEKYLDILALALGTNGFVNRWRAYNADRKQMEADPTVAGIRRLEPLHDTFETQYTEPAFLGYNLKLVEGRSQQALLNSIAVCLYTKLMPPFMERVGYLGQEGILQNPIVSDALAMRALKMPDILRTLPQLSINLERYKGFIRQMSNVGATGDTEQRMPYAMQFFERGQGYYPYYYFFGNLRATHKKASARYGYGTNDGVN